MLRSLSTPRFVRYTTGVHKAIPTATDGCDGLDKSLLNNELFKKLRSKYENKEFQVVENDSDSSSELNLDMSLPMTVFPKQEIFAEVMKDDKISGWRKPFVQWLRLGIRMTKYYRDGLRDTYRVAKDSKNLIKDCKLDSKTPVVTQLYKLIEFNEIASRLKKEADPLPLNRKEFVKYHRRNQVWKLPTFFIIALAFEEFTAAVCYLFPKVAPHNCLTPGAYYKVCRTHTNNLASWNTLQYQSPYTIPESSLFHILRRTPVIQIPKWKLKTYELLGIRKAPSETLMQIHQYLFIDDWFLLKHLLHSGATTLSRKELVNCIFERQLFSAHEDLCKMVSEEEGRELLASRLFVYWSFRFNGTVTVGENQLFSEKWGVNNVAILNYSGLVGNKQLDSKHLSTLLQNGI